MSIRVVIADDHRLLRESLHAPLSPANGIDIVGEASTGAAAIETAGVTRPDVLVVDIALPDMNGIDVVRRVAADFPAIRVVALSGYADRLFIEEMLKAGASAYVTKSASTEELLSGIRAAAVGQRFLCSEATTVLLGKTGKSNADVAPPVSVLTGREREVLQGIAEGLTTRSIASRLSISAATVDVHRRNLREKLGIHSAADLTRYALREGLIRL